MMKLFRVTDALNREQSIMAESFSDAVAKIDRTGRRNVFGVSGRHSDHFYLDRGTGPLYRIGVSVAAVELAMGGFK